MERGRRERQHDGAGLAIGAGLAAVLVLAGWLRHRHGWSGGLDLGIFDQGVWLMSRGLAPDVTVNGRNLFADHVSPVVLLFVPAYLVAATPVWLISGQAVALGAAVIPIRRLASDNDVSRSTVTLAYVLSAPILAAAIFDFHPSTLAVLPLAWLVRSMQRDARAPVLFSALGVLLCRADLGWTVAASAVAAPRRHRIMLVLAGIAGTVVGFVVPSALGGEGTFEIHYGHLGRSPGDALAHPWRLLTGMASGDLITVFLWMLGGGLLLLLAPRWLAALVVAGLPILLSRWPGTEDPYTHYGAPLVPLILAGAVAGLRRHHRRSDPRLLVAGALVASLLAGPLSPKAPMPYSVATLFERNFDGHLEAALAQVEPGEPIAATNRILPHLTHRRLAYGFPIPFVTSDLSVLYGGADPEAAAMIHVVLGEPSDARRMRDFGYAVEDLGGIVIGRRE